MKELFVLFDSKGDLASSWSKPGKIPVFKTQGAAEQNKKHYRGEGINVVKFIRVEN